MKRLSLLLLLGSMAVSFAHEEIKAYIGLGTPYCYERKVVYIERPPYYYYPAPAKVIIIEKHKHKHKHWKKVKIWEEED
ncbi:hypothetical protein Thal_1336 [Thermocrinis albus DSM 14484]|uniref:Uncharacterized protein n=1 Tax=Thermocrinis albus (strain DSM 14484 / JCM 11386 / HI 11/12) TaxID=638303 RepID=D3SMI7_THEAH|nr:hypothetical protein [Thermocrinis albus]ADC89967.1 hypothetical protein Thal_1336 [Thermocrinis albus DSM 14484]